MARYHRIIPSKIFISQVSLDEVINKRELHKSEKVTEFHRNIEALNRLTFIKSNREEIIKLESKNEFETQLHSFLSSNGMNLLPYPSISHRDIVKYSSTGKRPFKNNDSGYKDFLIWTSIKELLKSEDEDVLFVSYDGDFQKDNSLHKDLVEDLQESGIDSNRIIIYSSLKELNNKHLLAKFSSEPVDKILSKDQITSLIKNVEYELLQHLNGNCVSNTNIKTSHKYEDVIIDKIESINNIEFTDARHIDDNKIQLTANSMNSVIINYYVDSVFMDSLPINAEILDDKDGVIEVSESKQVCAQTLILYDLKTNKIDSILTDEIFS